MHAQLIILEDAVELAEIVLLPHVHLWTALHLSAVQWSQWRLGPELAQADGSAVPPMWGEVAVRTDTIVVRVAQLRLPVPVISKLERWHRMPPVPPYWDGVSW